MFKYFTRKYWQARKAERILSHAKFYQAQQNDAPAVHLLTLLLIRVKYEAFYTGYDVPSGVHPSLDLAAPKRLHKSSDAFDL